MPIRKDPNDKGFGIPEQPAGKATTVETTADDLPAEQSEPGLLQRVGGKVKKILERDVVELQDGSAVTTECAAVIRDHPGAVFMGSEVICLISTMHDGVVRQELYDPAKHTTSQLAARRLVLKEYVFIHNGKLIPQSTNTTLPEIWLVESRRVIGPIGRTPSAGLLRRLNIEKWPPEDPVVAGG